LIADRRYWGEADVACPEQDLGHVHDDRQHHQVLRRWWAAAWQRDLPSLAGVPEKVVHRKAASAVVGVAARSAAYRCPRMTREKRKLVPRSKRGPEHRAATSVESIRSWQRGSDDGGFFMPKKRETKVASNGGPELTSAGVPWSEVPEFARVHVAWIDGRHGSAQSSLPPVDVVPVPDILYRLPYLHEERPVDRKPCSIRQAREGDCEMCVPALGSSVLIAAGNGPSGRMGT
jgi:hypothetical protein